LPLLLIGASGCGTFKTTGTTRSGTEQLLLTNAWDSALQKVDFRPLTGVPVYLDTTNVTAVDQGWVVSSLRQRMLADGVLLRAKADQAQWIVEARVGAYGTDDYNWLIGISQTTVPQTITGMPAGTIPELPLIKKSNQLGVAKLALFAYDRASGQIVWSSGTMLATSSAKDVYIGVIGPIQSGSIRPKANIVGVKIPLLSEPGANEDGDRPNPNPMAPFDSAALRQTERSDLESFKP
jgi:hypothetical protein